MKKIGLFLLFFVIVIILAMFLPWENIGSLREKLLGEEQGYASLKVYSLGGNMKVFVDDEEKGTVQSETAYLEIFPIEVGDHKIKLVRESSSDGFYETFEKNISFEKGFDTVISWELGPSEESTSGWILYADKGSISSDDIKVNLISSPDVVNVLVDDKESVETPISGHSLSLDKQHTLVLSRDGYQPLEIPVLPEEDEARRLLAGYELFIEANLYKLPI